MVLQGNEEGMSPPFDSSIYGASYSPGTPGTEYEIEYSDCDALMAFFRCSEDVVDILPEGVEPFSQPPQGGIFVTRYPFSTVGTYNEFLAVVQVKDTNGDMAYYIPYIYVTNDAAMAAGREWAGAPKKIADIEMEKDKDVLQGTMERPEGKRLLTITSKPEERAKGGIIDALLPDPT
ncbi:MAG: acetoacetate decarboxylase family protein, partial [Halobacteria archaeon]|nr:acetoacetate decarboxylase family protein [Halobacteria archaeon]